LVVHVDLLDQQSQDFYPRVKIFQIGAVADRLGELLEASEDIAGGLSGRFGLGTDPSLGLQRLQTLAGLIRPGLEFLLGQKAVLESIDQTLQALPNAFDFLPADFGRQRHGRL
jgi:hypothetical protein